MDDVKCSNQMKCSEKIHVKSSQWFGVYHFACPPEVDYIFLKLKKWQVPTGTDANFTVFLCHSPSYCRSGEILLIDPSWVNKGTEHAELLRWLLFLQYSFRGFICIYCHFCLKTNIQLLNWIPSAKKYEWAHKKECG
jgi:hypothetical protein